MGASNLSETCYSCRGTGTTTGDQGGGSIDCPVCGGSGLRKYGELDQSDIMDKLNDIKEKVDEIKEVVDNP